MTFADPWGDIFEERNADSFVDDTSNGCNDAHLETAMPFAELIAMDKLVHRFGNESCTALAALLN